MIYQRLVALFARYAAEHLSVTIPGPSLFGQTGEMLGHVDRITVHDQRLRIEGWADAPQIVLCHAGLRQDLTPNLPREDVRAAHTGLRHPNCGFAFDLALGTGPATLTLGRDDVQLVHQLNLPTARRIRRAHAALMVPFLHALFMAAPIFLRWFATKDPACRTRLKHHFRLAPPLPTQAMQPLLFLQDCLSLMPIGERAAEIARLQPAALAHRAITIVLPIYNAFDLLPEVLDRVIRNTDLPWRLIVIDDASPDPALRPFLRGWVAARNHVVPGRITLIENKENQGFIRSVNAGLALAIGHGDHVVLLNSDAFVPQGWATRLMRPFLTHDRVATVTPRSTDAEIFSAPVICRRSPLAPDEADQIDALAATMHPDAALADAPTGVGFCMAMSIDYLRRIPALDTTFGRGYGEEVDWCQKARALGGRHLGLANLFVEHRGGSSFGATEKQRLVARNNAVISQRYPDYDADVQRYIAADPLAAPRLALAIAWAAGRATGPVPIYIAHDLGGGAEDYLAHRITAAMPDAAVVLRLGTALRWQLELHCADGITRGSTNDFSLIQRLLDPVRQRRIVYSCGVGDADPADLPAKMLALKRGLQDQIDILIHDYFPISPSYSLLNGSGQYCGLPDANTTDPAHSARRPDGASLALQHWQAEWGSLITAADDITVFSPSSAAIMAAAYPQARGKLRLTPHRLLVDLPPVRAALGERPVIGVLGNIGFHKGAGVLRELSQKLDQSGAATLVVLGRLDPMYRLAASAQVHGGYLRQDIPALVARYGITDWLIPSIWPETFSYTTHEAIATRLPVWCFDLGAQADAVRQSRRGGVIPIPDGVPSLSGLLHGLLQMRNPPESAAA